MPPRSHGRYAKNSFQPMHLRPAGNRRRRRRRRRHGGGSCHEKEMQGFAKHRQRTSSATRRGRMTSQRNGISTLSEYAPPPCPPCFRFVIGSLPGRFSFTDHHLHHVGSPSSIISTPEWPLKAPLPQAIISRWLIVTEEHRMNALEERSSLAFGTPLCRARLPSAPPFAISDALTTVICSALVQGVSSGRLLAHS